MEHFISILGLISIVLFVYVAMAVYKRLTAGKESGGMWRRLIPLWALIIGVTLAIIFFVNIPEIMPAGNLLTASILGAFCGWGAVGANQFSQCVFGNTDKRGKEQKNDKEEADE